MIRLGVFECALYTVVVLKHASMSFVLTARRQPCHTGQVLFESTTENLKVNGRFKTSTLTSKSEAASRSKLTDHQVDFCRGYLNKHHEDFLLKLAQACSPLGSEMAKANVWSGGSMALTHAKVSDLTMHELSLDVTVNRRKRGDSIERITLSLDADPVSERKRYYDVLPRVSHDPGRLAIDDVLRRLQRLCWIVKDLATTGKLTQLGFQLGGSTTSQLHKNMYLNQVPHNRYVRQYFYDHVSEAALHAVKLCSADGKLRTNRMQIISQFPEMNPSMDSYRIGTILEMARAICIRLAEENLRVRLCVQGSMGVGIFTGVPKQLSGVARLIQNMDWQSNEGEENEGMVGDYVNFGGVGASHVANEQRNADGGILQYQDDVFVIIAPQSMTGEDSSIIPDLQAMVDSAGDRPVILLNPDLSDKVSAAGQQGIRGRGERMEFAKSFETIYHFQNIYVSGTSYFPILGAITKMRVTEPWVAHQRLDFADNEGEIYLPVLAGEAKPEGEGILSVLQK